MLIGLFGGIEMEGCRDLIPAAAATPTQTAVPANPIPKVQENVGQVICNPKQQRDGEGKAKTGAEREE
jgi:hypothetical protein